MSDMILPVGGYGIGAGGAAGVGAFAVWFRVRAWHQSRWLGR